MLAMLEKRKGIDASDDHYSPRRSSCVFQSEWTALIAEYQKLPTLDGAISMTSSTQVFSVSTTQPSVGHKGVRKMLHTLYLAKIQGRKCHTPSRRFHIASTKMMSSVGSVASETALNFWVLVLFFVLFWIGQCGLVKVISRRSTMVRISLCQNQQSY